AAFGLHQDHPVHAVGNVVGDHRGRAVVHVQARLQRLEAEALGLAGGDLGDRRAATGAGDRVEVHRVDVDAALVVLEVDGDVVALAHPQHRAGHGGVEGPVAVVAAVRQLALHVGGQQVE